MRSDADYLALVPPLNASKAKFMAEVAMLAQPFADMQAFLLGLQTAFDIDSAVGVQEDAVGEWVGISRNIPIPIPNAFFSFDTQGLGFDQGYWFGTFGDPSTYLDVLDDDTYRLLLYAKVAANNSNGTIADIQGILDAYFPKSKYPLTYVFVLDEAPPPSAAYFSFDDAAKGFDLAPWYNGGSLGAQGQWDMAIMIVVAGKWPTVVDLEVLAQQILPLRGAGVRLDYAVTTADGAPVFGLDLNNRYIAGLDVGAFGADPGFVAQNLVV